MKKYFDKNKSYLLLKGLLVNQYDDKTITYIWSRAEENYASLIEFYKDAPTGEIFHLHNSIIPRIAMYKALCEKIEPSEAISLLDKTINVAGTSVGTTLRKITNFPGMSTLFMFLFSKMVKNMFGNKNGFTQVFYEDSLNKLRFDITKCPYCKYCQENNCSELTHTFCDSDVYCYGNMKRIKFERTKTLGTGGECCDFKLIRR